MYVYVFLAVNQYANEAWSVILLQLISLNPPSPGLGTAHAHRHAWVNTAAHTHAHTHKLVLIHWLKHPTSQKYKHSFAYTLKHLSQCLIINHPAKIQAFFVQTINQHLNANVSCQLEVI